MKYFIVSIFLLSCLAKTYCTDIQDSIDPSTNLSDRSANKEIVNAADKILKSEKESLKDLKQSAVSKAETIVNGVKTATKSKLGVIASMKATKLSILKGMASAKYAKLAAIQNAKSTMVGNYLAAKKAHLSKVIGKISAKSKGLFEHKLPIKETSAILFSGAVSKAQNELSKKKAILTLLKKPITKDSTILHPVNNQESQKLHTFVTNENSVVGKIFVQELPVKATEPSQVKPVNGQLSNAYGPPVNTYGAPVNTYGAPINTYETPVAAA